MEAPNLVKKQDQTPSSETEHRALFEQIIRDDPDLMTLLHALRVLDLPDWRLVAGCLYQTVWNRLTHRPQGYGIKDYDIAYFDDQDLSYEAEDRVIQTAKIALPDWEDKIEVRNQARVHLWYADKFGGEIGDYPQLTHTDQSLENYLCTTNAIAVRLQADDSLSIAAPFGLSDIFSLTLRRCATHAANRKNYIKKAKTTARLWPEVKILDWQSGQPIRPDQM
ncbi:MAG: nucleotidyltransferase family protein [Cohaesibacter sp.]|nr:nucleotidyltransferase family protein [Cohaesibacter sp.]